MKIKVRPDHASTLQKYGWAQMGHRLAELRDDSRTEPPAMATPKRTAPTIPGRQHSPRPRPSPRPAPRPAPEPMPWPRPAPGPRPAPRPLPARRPRLLSAPGLPCVL